MSQSKTNKSHKERVKNFKQNIKNQRKMSEVNIPESPIAQQYPVWNSKDSIEMNGLEFEAIYNFLNLFRNAVMAGESILQKNLENGKIHFTYKDKDGKDVPEDVVKDYQAQIQKYFAAQQQLKVSSDQPITAEEQKDLPKIDALVDANGKEIKS